ncbi:MAG: acetolactate synthase small subunit [Clostridia bacterium]|nr:acetolactate synthase small subunit [Clostridia bacterium]
MAHKQIISLFVHNHPGVLLRVTSLFTRRGFNIDSLTVSPAGTDGYSRMTIRIEGDDNAIEQFINQVMKIVDVKKAEALPQDSSVASELILIKVSTKTHNDNDILAVTSSYHASLVNIGENSLTFRASGTPDEIDTLVKELDRFGILEMARTGIAALENGDRCLNNNS